MGVITTELEIQEIASGRVQGVEIDASRQLM
jgi:hypothetical protein